MFGLIASALIASTPKPYCDIALFGDCTPTEQRPVKVECPPKSSFPGCIPLPEGTVTITIEKNRISFLGRLGLVVKELSGYEKEVFLKIIGQTGRINRPGGYVQIIRK